MKDTPINHKTSNESPESKPRQRHSIGSSLSAPSFRRGPVPARPLLDFWRQWLNVPDAISVLDDAAIAREESHAADARDALCDPFFLVPVSLVDECVGLDVTVEVIADEIVVAVVGNGVDQSRKSVLVAKHVSANGLEDLLKVRINSVRTVVMVVSKILNVFGEIAEEENVRLAYLTSDFNLNRR